MISKAEWRRRQRIKQLTRLGAVVLLGVTILLALIFGIVGLFSDGDKDEATDGTANQHLEITKPHITERFLTVSEYSRPGAKLEKVNGIIVHAAPDTASTASDNWTYYEGLQSKAAESMGTDLVTAVPVKESVHFIIDLSGEIIQCIPLEEISLSAKERNYDTISIEYCYKEADGKLSDETSESLIGLLSWLCDEYKLDRSQVLRHSDVTNKACPEFYTTEGAEWEALLDKVVFGE